MVGMASFGGGGAVVNPNVTSYVGNPIAQQQTPAQLLAQGAPVATSAAYDPAALGNQAAYESGVNNDGWRKFVGGLNGSGYNGSFDPNSLTQSGYNQTSALGQGGKWGDVKYSDALANAQSSGDWSQVSSLLDFANKNPRERSGSFGLGIDLMPHSLGGALLAAGGAAAGLGAFSGFGIPGLVPGSGVAGSTNALATGSGGLSASGNAFSGISGFNAASPYAQALSSGSSLGSLAGLGSTGNLVGNAAIGLGTNAAPSSLWGNLSKLSKAGNLAGGGQQQEQGGQGYGNYMGLSPSIPNINAGIPDFHYGNYDSSNVVSNGLQGSLGNAQRQPFMSVIDKFNARYK